MVDVTAETENAIRPIAKTRMIAIFIGAAVCRNIHAAPNKDFDSIGYY
jgi:hypothetical protein